MKQLIIISLIVIGIIGGAVALSGNDDTAQGSPSDNYYGQENAEVVVTEYGDFQCPACAQFFPIVKEVKEKYKDQIRFEFKHFPLVQLHPNAIAAHRAAQAAALQGKFWEMHDLLYQNQNSWESLNISQANDMFQQYAENLGLDIDRYNEDRKSSDVIGTINADKGLGDQAGVTGTPGFVINGELLTDTNQLSTVEGFSELIDNALGESNSSSNETSGDAAIQQATPDDTGDGSN